MEQSIQQLNLGYHAAQDRMLLKAGVGETQEVQLWITFRIARFLFAILNNDAHLPVAVPAPTENPTQAVEQFAQEAQAMEALKSLDFETAYQAERKPLIEAEELLVTELHVEQIEHVEQGTKSLKSLKLQCANGFSIQLNLSTELVLALANMLQLAAKDAQWPLAGVAAPTATSAFVMAEPANKQVLH